MARCSHVLLSITAAIVAVILTYALKLQTPLREATTYCYDSVTTLAPKHSSANGLQSKPNCFSVTPSGLFSRVFFAEPEHLEPDVIRSPGHVIPGLWDGHGHLLQYGELLQSVNLFGSASMAEAVSRVRQYLTEHADVGSKSEWIRGTGWDQAAFGRMPTAVGCVIFTLCNHPTLITKGLFLLAILPFLALYH
jgi:hypothetical protein